MMGRMTERLDSGDEAEFLSFSTVECRERLGGLLTHYHRQAA